MINYRYIQKVNVECQMGVNKLIIKLLIIDIQVTKAI